MLFNVVLLVSDKNLSIEMLIGFPLIVYGIFSLKEAYRGIGNFDKKFLLGIAVLIVGFGSILYYLFRVT